MDDLLCGNSLYDEGEESDFKYILDSDVFHNVPLSEQLVGEGQTYTWFNTLFDDPMLCDKDFEDAPSPSPRIQTEHSYSLSSVSEPSSPVSSGFTEDEDLDLDNFDLPFLDIQNNLSSIVKPEPSDAMDTHYILKEPLPVVPPPTTGSTLILPNSLSYNNQSKQETIQIKLEPLMLDYTADKSTVGMDELDLPPTPPNSNGSDSDGGSSTSSQSPEPGSPHDINTFVKKHEAHTRIMPLFTNTQRLPQTGPLILSEEEKRTLTIEGYPIPNKLPLTKAEEKSLKKIRRKIKNKISAQESRRKKKEYVEALEKKMESFTQENTDLKRKLQSMESTNKTLAAQLQKLQIIVNKVTKPLKANSTQSGTCLMVLVLCFAVFLGGWSPQSLFGKGDLRLTPSQSHPTYGPLPSSYYNSKYYSENPEAKPSAASYGPQLDNSPYSAFRSSRMLFSYDDGLDNVKPAQTNPYVDQTGNPLLNKLPTATDKIGAADMAAMLDSKGANVGGFGEASMNGALQAVMHPDIEAQLVVMDSIRRLNNSKNK